MEDRHAVMKLTFADRLAYVRGEGFRTPETTLPFKALGGISGSNIEMARPERFELPTAWFVARYSIQLSYGRALKRSEQKVVFTEPSNSGSTLAL